MYYILIDINISGIITFYCSATEIDALPVDESLFENVEDLELEDDSDEDDKDYVPGDSDSNDDDDGD